ncbi:hypothetical protein ACM66B_003980 [Microbotryomycetes sp. NB124-2]
MTGFGPFYTYKQNPSWLAVEPLTNTTIEHRPLPLSGLHDDHDHRPLDDHQRPIHITTTLVPVTYEASNATTQRIHSTEQPFDLVVHVGVGLSGQIKLETRARKFGYDKPDVENLYAKENDLGQRGFVEQEFDSFETTIKTDLDVYTVIEWCQSRGKVEHIMESEDAGLYLCEYTLYGSMARSRIRAQLDKTGGASLQGDTRTRTPVQFVHVPPLGPGEPYDVEQLTNALRLIVWAMLNEGGVSQNV